MPNIKNMILKEVFDLTFKDFNTKQYLGTADQFQDMTLAQSQEDTFVLGKNDVKLYALSKNKEVTLSGTSAQFHDFLLALQVGTEIETGDYRVEQIEVLTVDANSVKLTYKPEAANIKFVYVLDINDSIVKVLTQVDALDAESPVEGVFALDKATGVITLNEDELIDGDRVKVVYNAIAKGANRVTNDSQKFSKIAEVTGVGRCVDACSDEEYLIYLTLPKAKISGTFDVSLGSEPAVQNFECSAMTGCGQTNLWDWIIADESTLEKIV